MIVSGPRGSIRLSRPGRQVLQLSVRGEFDAALALPLTEALDVDPYINGDSDVELDLSQVSYVDSTGIRLLLQARSRVHASGHALKITAVSPFAYRILEITELVQVLDVPPPDGEPPRPF